MKSPPAWLVAAAFLSASPALAEPVWGDGRDLWNLFDQKLIDRQLSLQIDGDPARLGQHLDPFAVAADVWVGAQVAPDTAQLTRFHGFFVSDLFGQAKLGDWMDVNVNLTLTNPSASDGYRYSSFVLPGLALHVHHDLFNWRGDPVHLDFVAPDLDLVTTGEGLLVENLPLEGYRGSLRWRDFDLSVIFGGQAYFLDDDYTTLQATALGGRVGIEGTLWDLPSALDPQTGQPDLNSPTKDVYYGGVFGNLPLFQHARVAGEAAARRDGNQLRYAALLRADWMRRDLGRVQIHLGWQFRYYAKHFSPQSLDETPKTSPALPYREEAYVTNAFEYFYLSREYDQWSHTGMAELRVRLWRRLTAVLELEEWLRYVSDPGTLPRVAYTRTQDLVPGVVPRIYYRAGIEWMFEYRARFRGQLFLTNKTVNSQPDILETVEDRFANYDLLLFRFEAQL